MGIFSAFKKVKANASQPSVPSEEQQREEAKAYIDAFLDKLYTDFDKVSKDSFTTARFRIAGITNYCTLKDVGIISGLSFPQNNPYDKTAIALGWVKGNSIGGIYGYIPKEKKEDFNEFAGDNKQLPFLGYIKPFIDEEERKGIMGVVKFYNGNCAGVYEEMIRDALIMHRAFKGYVKFETLDELGEELETIFNR